MVPWAGLEIASYGLANNNSVTHTSEGEELSRKAYLDPEQASHTPFDRRAERSEQQIPTQPWGKFWMLLLESVTFCRVIACKEPPRLGHSRDRNVIGDLGYLEYQLVNTQATSKDVSIIIR